MSTAPSILCPRCKGALEAVGQNQLRCPADGATYELLFSRHGSPAPAAGAPTQTAVPPPLIPPASPPGAQPGMPAPQAPQYQASQYQAAPQYQVPQPPGAVQTVGQPLPPPPGAGAAHRPAVPQPPGVPAYPGAAAPPPLIAQAPAAAIMYGGAAAVAHAAPLPDGSTCVQHSTMAAICRCSKCASPTCNTCAFWLEDGLVLCPACVVPDQDGGALSGRRKLFVFWSLGLAIFATVVPLLCLLVALGMEADPEMAMGFAAVAGFIGFYPSLVGLGLGAGAIRWGQSNPVLSWVGLVWNAIIVIPVILILLVGVVTA